MRSILQLSALLISVSITSTTVVRTPAGNEPGTFELLILHNNDMHARFEQTSQLSGACTTADRDAGKCYGGFPRVAHVVKEARKAAASGEGPPVLYLNAGDTYTGTAWFTIYKWRIAAEFVNALQPDAVSLGNIALENESRKLSPFLENIQTTILACNVILNSEDNNTKVQKSVIMEIEGRKVGIVGYFTPDTKTLDSSVTTEYIDEILAIKDEVAKFKKENVTIIIALGHADFDKNIEIAREVDGIDMVIASQSDTFSSRGNLIHGDSQEYEDIVLVKQLSGKEVPVVKSQDYNKYLGKFVTTFDSNGEIVSFDNAPIILDENILEDPDSAKIVKQITDELVSRSEEVIGETAVVLDGESCKTEECNLGNLITDAIMYMYALKYKGERWTDAPIAVIPGGAIAALIAPPNRPAAITRGDLITALPDESNIVIVTMNGTVLKQVMEHSISSYSVANPSERFLQFSGVRLVYDLKKEVGSRVVDAVVRCWDCIVPQFFTVDDWRTYKILMPETMANGMYGYEMLAGLPRDNVSMDQVTSTADFIQLRSPVYPEVAGRIRVTNFDADADNSATDFRFTVVLLVVSVIHLIV